MDNAVFDQLSWGANSKITIGYRKHKVFGVDFEQRSVCIDLENDKWVPCHLIDKVWKGRNVLYHIGQYQGFSG